MYHLNVKNPNLFFDLEPFSDKKVPQRSLERGFTAGDLIAADEEKSRPDAI
jgi:hypothetical protein